MLEGDLTFLVRRLIVDGGCFLGNLELLRGHVGEAVGGNPNETLNAGGLLKRDLPAPNGYREALAFYPGDI
jgi:hypothetical protein